LEEKPNSVVSHRGMEEIAQEANGAEKSHRKTKTTKPSRRSGKRRVDLSNNGPSAKAPVKPMRRKDVATLPGARPAAVPRKFRPQLATLVAEAPSGHGRLHEVKLDGYRILAFVREGKVRLLSRNGGDWTQRFAVIGRAVQSLKVANALFDGEVVCLNSEGMSDFQQLQNWLKEGGKAKLVYYVFDLPHFDGFNLTATPLKKRKELLSRLLLSNNAHNAGVLRYNDHVRNDGAAVVQQACRLGLEGIVSKDAESGYIHGRSRSWLKTKCLRRQEFVIGGYTRPSGARQGFGALLLGRYEGHDFIYCGRVGTGFTEASLRQIASELKRHRTDHPPFINPPTSTQRRGVTWLRPELVGEVEFSQWTKDGLLRHPSFRGLREDKAASEIVREQPQAVPKKKRRVTRVSRRNKP
jgi:bifunctional non-homologous end joining protein LigD